MSRLAPEFWAAIRAFPCRRREAAHVCELCGHRVGAIQVVPGAPPLTIDYGPQQRLVADLVVDCTAGRAARLALPPWSWCPTSPMPHECPPVGDSPLAEQARRKRQIDCGDAWEVP